MKTTLILISVLTSGLIIATPSFFNNDLTRVADVMFVLFSIFNLVPVFFKKKMKRLSIITSVVLFLAVIATPSSNDEIDFNVVRLFSIFDVSVKIPDAIGYIWLTLLIVLIFCEVVTLISILRKS